MRNKKIMVLIAGIVLALGVIGAITFLALSDSTEKDNGGSTGLSSILKTKSKIHEEFSILKNDKISYVLTAKSATNENDVTTTEVDPDGNSRTIATVNGKKITTITVGSSTYTCEEDGACAVKEAPELTEEEKEQAKQFAARIDEEIKKNAKYIGEADCPGGLCAVWQTSYGSSVPAIEGLDMPEVQIKSTYTFMNNGRLYKTETEGEYGSISTYEYKNVPAIKAPQL